MEQDFSSDSILTSVILHWSTTTNKWQGRKQCKSKSAVSVDELERKCIVRQYLDLVCNNTVSHPLPAWLIHREAAWQQLQDEGMKPSQNWVQCTEAGRQSVWCLSLPADTEWGRWEMRGKDGDDKRKGKKKKQAEDESWHRETPIRNDSRQRSRQGMEKYDRLWRRREKQETILNGEITEEGIKKETEWTEVQAGGREEERRQGEKS